MRTQDEIVTRLKGIAGDDFFGFASETLIVYLDYDQARPFLKDTATPESWATSQKPQLRLEAIKAEMADYMTFALDKAENHRGLSASRSIDRMSSWLWLLGDDELLEFASSEGNFANYGVPFLRKICEKYELPMPKGEIWFENMSKGRRCRAGCDEGCGR